MVKWFKYEESERFIDTSNVIAKKYIKRKHALAMKKRSKEISKLHTEMRSVLREKLGKW